MQFGTRQQLQDVYARSTLIARSSHCWGVGMQGTGLESPDISLTGKLQATHVVRFCIRERPSVVPVIVLNVVCGDYCAGAVSPTPAMNEHRSGGFVFQDR